MKNAKTLTYPICFKDIKKGVKKPFTHLPCHVNKFYGDNRFSPNKFFKPIIKLEWKV